MHKRRPIPTIFIKLFGKPAATKHSTGKFWRGRYWVRKGFAEKGDTVWITQTQQKGVTHEA